MIPQQQSDTIEIGHVVRTIAGRWRVVGISVAIGVLVAIMVVLFAPRRYTAEGSLVLKSTSSTGSSIVSQVTGLGDVTAGLLGGKSQMETEIVVLQSRAIMGEVVDSLWLQARMKSAEAIPPRKLFTAFAAPGTFPSQAYKVERSSGGYTVKSDSTSYEVKPGVSAQVGPATFTIAPDARVPAAFTLEIRDREDAIDWALTRLTVGKGKGEVATVAYSADDSLSAAAVPNFIFARYLERRRVIDKGVNQRRVEFLTAKNDSMTQSLTLALRALREQRESSGILSAEASGRIGLESVAELRGQLTGVLVEQGALRQLLGEIGSKALNPRTLAVYPTFLNSPAVNQLVVELTSTESKRTALLATRTPNDPEVAALTKAAEDIERQLIPYATTYGEALEKQRTDLERAIKVIEGELSQLPKAAERAGQLQFNVEDLAKMSAGLQAALVEAKLAAIGEGGDVRPLDLAVIPKKPSFPKPAPLLAAGVGGGLMIGMVIALVLGALGRWVRDPIELERSTGVPTIQYDPATPLLLANGASRTIVVAPVTAGLDTSGIVTRLAQTATWRSVSAVVLKLPEQAADVNAQIAKLESEHDLVIVELPSLTSDTAVATLQQGRPVLLVTPGPRTDRHRIVSAIEMLRRLEVPCAGVVIDSPKERPLIRIGRA
jgi:uncharacterized protein involved in exopolysaccharide biosynthesis